MAKDGRNGRNKVQNPTKDCKTCTRTQHSDTQWQIRCDSSQFTVKFTSLFAILEATFLVGQGVVNSFIIR
jgi:hypothetical protein